MRVVLFILLMFFCVESYAQQGSYYFLQFADKKEVPYQLNKPEAFLTSFAIMRRTRMGVELDSTDLPVSKKYIQSVIDLGFQYRYSLKWLNGAVFFLEDEISFNEIKLPESVVSTTLLKISSGKSVGIDNKFKTEDIDSAYYGNTFVQTEMINGQKVHQYSKGQGVRIAVLDNGFMNVDKINGLKNVFLENRYLGAYDFVDMDSTVFDKGTHGTSVFSIMAGISENEYMGAAPEASYLLLRTEEDGSETPLEEYNWMAGIELADSMGCDVVNSSLGYYVFDQLSSANHTYEQMDGRTLAISKVANMAVDKGILVVSSAGNERNKSWKYVIAPAEAENVLAIGAVDINKNISSFSSPGYDHKEPLKPNVCAMGSASALFDIDGNVTRKNGTSFSSPLVAGVAACLMGIFPDALPKTIKRWIEESGDRFSSPDTDYGYGIPDFGSILDIYKNEVLLSINARVYPNPFEMEIKVDFDEACDQILIYNFTGKQVYKQNNCSLGQLNLGRDVVGVWNSGLYLVVLQQKDATKVYKVVKK